MRRLAGSLLGLTVVAEAAAVALSWGLEPAFDTAAYTVSTVVMAAAGALVAARRPGNPIGWLLCGFALLHSLASDVGQGWGLRAAAEGWPGGPVGETLAASSWLAGGYGWILTFLRFPDGRLPGPRWRAVHRTGVAGLALALPGWALSPDRVREYASGHNPVAVPALPTDAMVAVGMVLFIGALVASGASLVVRFRRAAGVERQQLKWFAVAGVWTTVALPLSFLLWYRTPMLAGALAAVALTLLPIAACVAILRYRLYDIDVIIDRTVVYATVTVLLAGAYGLTTLTLGATLGGGSGWVTAAATLVVAVAFRPLRDRVQDAVDRRFHRARHAAVRRMGDFLEALRAGRAAPEEVQAILRELTGDPGLRLLLFLPESQVYVGVDGRPATDTGDGIDVERAGRPVGRVRTDRPAPDPLLRRLIEAGGLAIEITRLHVELRRQLAEVHASRARIVNAVTEERRRLERDLHDGAQQRLVSIGLALRHAQHQLGANAVEQADRTLEEAVAEVRAAIDELRELARGLPPAQLDAGLAPAFRDLARRAPVPVEVSVPGERFGRGTEGAAYFIGCEGLTNAVKHARATSISLRAHRERDRLVVTVADDGVGGAVPVPGSGLSGLADRVAALGGALRIDSRPGAGTTLTAELPCES
ncbi:sensor histidine kinase [Dactylosporangium sp. NPDC005572]|uniref:sensor histidine kinase n=1 Tax=Dactylosporangium sp. NPDC005572 TaxID=3156889 RepID=UPI0033B87C8B